MYQIEIHTTFTESKNTYHEVEGTFDNLQDAERAFYKIINETSNREAVQHDEHHVTMWLNNREYCYATMELEIKTL